MEDEDRYTITDDSDMDDNEDAMLHAARDTALEALLHATERVLEREKKAREQAMPSDEFRRICTVSSASLLIKQAVSMLKEATSMDLGVDIDRQRVLAMRILESLGDYADFMTTALDKARELDVWKERKDDGDEGE